jgi:hypothetical protein
MTASTFILTSHPTNFNFRITMYNNKLGVTSCNIQKKSQKNVNTVKLLDRVMAFLFVKNISWKVVVMTWG